jgi:YD repeat-containing protein
MANRATWVLTESRLVLLALVLAAMAGAAHCETTNYYDRSGRRVGSETRQNSTTYFYGGNGALSGTARPLGNSLSFYDRSGKRVGTQREVGNTTYFYDGSGSLQGTARATGNTINYYDRSGARVGSERPVGSSTSYYGSSGALEGRSSTLSAGSGKPKATPTPNYGRITYFGN